jgi:hypothetical protein
MMEHWICRHLEKIYFISALIMFIIIPSERVFGAWPEDPSIDVPICTANGTQEHPRITTDGASGAIIVWQDMSSSSDVYAQRIDARGQVRWTKDGVAICIESGDQWFPNLVSDGAGGAIIAWWDKRASFAETDIYAQRIDADGEILWKPGGIPICKATGPQQEFDIISDGKGGAIVVWHDYRDSYEFPDIYAQRVSPRGEMLWTPDGAVVSNEAGEQVYPNLTTDGANGAIITWHDGRNGNLDIYAQHIDSNGKQVWKKNGIPICTAPGSQMYSAITSDGNGGAVITWMDDRRGEDWDVYAQRVDSQGKILWDSDCVPICTMKGDQYDYSIVGDEKGGAFITWRDQRNKKEWHIYAQKVDTEGNAKWTKNGIIVCNANGSQYNPNMVSDDDGGVILTWWDERDVSADIYAQRINTNGKFLWVKNGAAICTAEGGQQDPYLVNSGIGSAIITWWDKRRVDADIYVQRVLSE